jgi:hypothetical protein
MAARRASLVFDSSPREDRSAVPVDDGAQVDEAAFNPDIGDVHRPDLVRPVDHHAAQQVAEDRVRRMFPREVRLPINHFQSYLLHQPAHPFSVYLLALTTQPPRSLPRAEDRYVSSITRISRRFTSVSGSGWW